MNATTEAPKYAYLKQGLYHFGIVSVFAIILSGCQTTPQKPINSTELDFGDFKPWQQNSWNYEGGYSIVADPAGSSELVEKFSLSEFKCAKGDCKTQSSRWEKVENVYDHLPKGDRGQPAEAWYGWQLFFNAKQPFGLGQPKGPIIMGQFKENRGKGCPHVAFWHHTRSTQDSYDLVLQANTKLPPPNDCKVVARKNLINVSKMRGEWTQFEFNIKWSLGDDGFIKAFVNGQPRFEYEGPTCFVDCDEFNNFRYGLYIANQRGPVSLKPIDVFFKDVRRSSSRDGLNR